MISSNVTFVRPWKRPEEYSRGYAHDMQFEIVRPGGRNGTMVLDPKIVLRFVFRIQKYDLDDEDTAQAFYTGPNHSPRDSFALHDGLIIQSAADFIELSINDCEAQRTRPRSYLRGFLQQFCPNDKMRFFEGSGGKFHSLDKLIFKLLWDGGNTHFFEDDDSDIDVVDDLSDSVDDRRIKTSDIIDVLRTLRSRNPDHALDWTSDYVTKTT